MAKSKGFNFIKRALMGGAIGGIASRATSSSHEASDNAKVGALVGALTGSLAPIAGSKILKSARKVAKAPRIKGKIIFRRIRGRLVPIRKK